MENTPPTPAIAALRLLLQSYGPLSPLAWQYIEEFKQQEVLKTHQQFVHRPGDFAYVAEGLLKEYGRPWRSDPYIVNFIAHNQCFITREFHKQQRMEAIMPSVVYYWAATDLLFLSDNFPELYRTYLLLGETYDAALYFHFSILGIKFARERYDRFRQKFAASLPFLAKTDIANYLNLSYHHLIKVSSQHP